MKFYKNIGKQKVKFLSSAQFASFYFPGLRIKRRWLYLIAFLLLLNLAPGCHRCRIVEYSDLEEPYSPAPGRRYLLRL